jgi:RNA polymerase sigma-70 factor (ECF subfamily)
MHWNDAHRSFRLYTEDAMSSETFGDLLAPNLKPIRRFVQRRMRNQDHVDDVMQQTLLLAFAHRHQLRSPSKFRSWLCSIAVNEIRLFVRSARKSLSLDELPAFAIIDSGSSPLLCYEEAECQTRLRAAMRRLHERDRLSLQFDLDGLTASQTAAGMDVSLSAVKSARFRARRHLAESMRRKSANRI